MATTGVIAINGIEYRLHYGMSAAEHFANLVVGENGKPRKATTQQILTCIIFYSHENWCDIHDEPFELKKGNVAEFIEEAYINSDQDILQRFADITNEFMTSRYIADLIKKGNDIKESGKKKETILENSSGSPTES